jgi:hypothetical protein
VLPPPSELAKLASRTRHVLIDFDGPVCDIFAGKPNHDVADELRRELRAAGIDIPPSVATLNDPLEVFRVVADLGDDAAIMAQERLTRLEIEAARTARPAPGSADLITTATQTGRTVTVVTNNSGAAVAAYLDQHQLTAYVGKIVGRDDPDPALMKPSPYRGPYRGRQPANRAPGLRVHRRLRNRRPGWPARWCRRHRLCEQAGKGRVLEPGWGASRGH